MTEETETPKSPDVAGRLDGLVGRAESLLNFLESDFGQSGRDVRIEAIVCEFEGLLGIGAKDTQAPMLKAVQEKKTKHCNKCGLWEGEWMSCDASDCGELV